MTWSIIARDPVTGHVGIAVATRFFAVGARVPHIRTGVGAVCTQAMSNPYYGPRGLELLAAGATAADTVRILTTADEGRDHRQLHVMDAANRRATWTGTSCIDWCGDLVRDHFSVAGNMLAGPRVIADTADFLQASTALAFPQRLIGALQAGEAAGGDKRGKQAAALLIHDGEEHAALDIRVDDHADPLAELARLEQVSRERWTHFRKFGPSRANPHGVLDRAELDRLIAESMAAEGKA